MGEGSWHPSKTISSEQTVKNAHREKKRLQFSAKIDNYTSMNAQDFTNWIQQSAILVFKLSIDEME